MLVRPNENEGILIQGNLKKFVAGKKFNSLLMILEKDKKELIIPVTYVLRRKLKIAKDKGILKSGVYIELRFRKVKNYYDVELKIDNVIINDRENETGIDLI